MAALSGRRPALLERPGAGAAFLISAAGAAIAAISVLFIPDAHRRQPATEPTNQRPLAANSPA